MRILCSLLLATLAFCDPTGPTQTTIVSIGGGSPSPIPTPDDCIVVRVEVGLQGSDGNDIKVNTNTILQAQALGAEGFLPLECGIPVIIWDAPSGTASCILSGVTSYTPTAFCTTTGNVRVVAHIESGFGDSTFNVVE